MKALGGSPTENTISVGCLDYSKFQIQQADEIQVHFHGSRGYMFQKNVLKHGSEVNKEHELLLNIKPMGSTEPRADILEWQQRTMGDGCVILKQAQTSNYWQQEITHKQRKVERIISNYWLLAELSSADQRYKATIYRLMEWIEELKEQMWSHKSNFNNQPASNQAKNAIRMSNCKPCSFILKW